MARHLFKLVFALLLCVTFVQAGHCFTVITEDTGPGRLDVPYVPTPENIVAEMIKMAGINKNDIVYDLGCGDGRIIIMACLKTGARGVGVDIDPDRIKESRDNARKANVAGKVTFLQEDLFKMDFSEATVLALYLLPELNERLRPRILTEMRPGTRVISHNYGMGDWEPDKTRRFDASHSIYFWVVPANVSGTWNLAMQDKHGLTYHILKLEQGYQVVAGNISAGRGWIPLSHVSLKGDELRFTSDISTSKGTIPVIFTGRARGNTLEGFFASPQDPEARGAWKAVSDPSTVQPLEGSGSKIRRILRELK